MMRSLGELLTIEHFMEVAIGCEHRLFCALEVAFRKLCFDQQITQPHINLGAIEPTVKQGNPSLVAKVGCAGVEGESGRSVSPNVRMAEDIHQKRV